MSVIVNNDMSVDLALRLLWREAMREGVIEKLQERRYYVPKTTKVHEVRKILAKSKQRRRKHARRQKK
jgi:ribosomal protein S21